MTVREPLSWQPAVSGLGVDMIEPAYYTVAHGDGQTTASFEASVDVVATQDLPRSAAHPFYTRLNQILDHADFDGHVETLCQRFYADEVGRPGLPPGHYFRMLLLGYFDGAVPKLAKSS